MTWIDWIVGAVLVAIAQCAVYVVVKHQTGEPPGDTFGVPAVIVLILCLGASIGAALA